MSGADVKPEGGFRTAAERRERERTAELFERSALDTATKLDTFPRYVRRQALTRFLVLYELFNRVLHVKGSIVECGVFRGFGLMSWLKLSAILEPVNLTRRIYGFDTFEGLKGIGRKDFSPQHGMPGEGALAAAELEELRELVELTDSTRFLGHISKVELIPGDARETIPQFIERNPHLVVSLLFLDFDLYEPTRVALEHFLPRMPRGAIVAFDELDNPLWPGETQAMFEAGGRSFRLQRLAFDPYVGFAVLE